jgi:hypothetical protein
VQQIVEYKESRDRQYALANYAADFGWPKERILVIDEDQGRSGRTVEQRPGFQRLLAEVTLDHVGLVVGLELSRLIPLVEGLVSPARGLRRLWGAACRSRTSVSKNYAWPPENPPQSGSCTPAKLKVLT